MVEHYKIVTKYNMVEVD